MNRPRNPYADWAKFASEASALYLESVSVFWLRSWQLMGGGKIAEREARLMVAEKIAANIEAASRLPYTLPLSSAAAASAALKPYRKRVKANHRRLSRKN